MQLFRRIYIDEIYTIHNTKATNTKSDMMPSTDALSGSGLSVMKDQTAFVSDNKLDGSNEHTAPPADGPLPRPVTNRADIDAEARYNEALDSILHATRIHLCRQRAEQDRGDTTHDSIQGAVEHRTAVASELQRMGPVPAATTNTIKASVIGEYMAPATRFLQRAPVVLRWLLATLSVFHPIECPSICLAGSGGWPSMQLEKKIAEYHDSQDSRIQDLVEEISQWVASADFCVCVDRLKGTGEVPFRAAYDINAGLQSKGVVVTRMDAGVASIRRVVQLKAMDASFVIPSCLLPFHTHLIPSEPRTRRIDQQEKLKADHDDRASHLAADGSDIYTADVHMSVRATLPVRFDESFLEFATTAAKTSQMVDIEKENGLAPEKGQPVSGHGQSNPDEDEHEHHSLRKSIKDKLAHGRIHDAIRHPAHNVKQVVHKEVKKAAVDKVDGAWYDTFPIPCLQLIVDVMFVTFAD
jgi:hypothetical protein